MEVEHVKRPTLLQFEHIKHQPQCHEAFSFIRESSAVWNTSSNKLGLVPDSLLHDLFQQINLHPTKQQINDMLQNARLYSSNLRYCNGLSFGEFSVLAADYRKFNSRTNQNSHQPFQITSLSPKNQNRVKSHLIDQPSITTTQNGKNGEELKVEAPEVFLGGSCNPTTWRADVAMPELRKLGISFYNPQVSQWTPDLIALENRAKDKARVLFFVMDSETRASAGAIEAAYIAGQNQKPLILVLHPYKRKQKILNEPISEEEFLDLSRNQKVLKQLVMRRGLPVLDCILVGLQRIKGIINGDEPCDLPHCLGSRLISVRRSYDRAIVNESGLSIIQCKQVLASLGYRKDLIAIDNLKRILRMVRNLLGSGCETPQGDNISSIDPSSTNDTNIDVPAINFEEFCVISSYLSVLQQEIEENCCVSPIKGTNLPPPPIFLTNAPELMNQYNKHSSQSSEDGLSINNSLQYRHVLSRSVTVDESQTTTTTIEERHSIVMMSNGPRSDSSRDSDLGSGITKTTNEDDDSDSSDSVFSTSSSLDEESLPSSYNDRDQCEVRDIYLGGSCALRTKWRRDIALPILKEKQATYYLPTLQENLSLKQLKKFKESEDVVTVLEADEDNDALMYTPRILDSSRVLLFVITNETRSLAPMTLAAHYIGLGYNVVLCIQMLQENCKIGNEQLTPSAVKDYNRGRAYLKDLAERQNIPVFDEIKRAVEVAVEKVKASKPRSSV